MRIHKAEIMNLQSYIRNFPVTTTIITINLCIFIFNKFGSLEYTISQPEILNTGTFLAHFSHTATIHFLMNMAIYIQISPLIEKNLAKKEYISILISIWLVLIALTFPLSQNPFLGFSGIIMGLLMFTILLYRKNKPFTKTLLSWLGINILIGLIPGISLLGHLIGALAGAITFGGYWIIKKI